MIPAAVIPKWPAEVNRRGWQVDDRRRLFVAGRRLRPRVRPQPPRSGRDRRRDRTRDGKVVWEQKYPPAFKKNQYADQMAKGPNSTPLVIGNRLFTLGVTGVLTAWNTADGRSHGGRTTRPGSTPQAVLRHRGVAHARRRRDVVQVGSDIHGGRILALDPATARALVVERPGPRLRLACRDHRRRAADHHDDRRLDRRCRRKNGKALWSIPFPDEWHENIITPIWTGTHLIVSGTRQGTHAYRHARRAESGSPRGVEEPGRRDVHDVSSVCSRAAFYGLSTKRRGHFVALRRANPARSSGRHKGVMATTRRFCRRKSTSCFSPTARLLVVARRTPDGFQEEKRYELGTGATWTLPVFLPDGLLVGERDRDLPAVLELDQGFGSERVASVLFGRRGGSAVDSK